MESPCLIPADKLSERLAALPREPGVYLMKDAQGRVIYVGKAGVLRTRVRSYFGSQEDLGPKVRAMVARVADFSYIVTQSEKEALLLENNLLKEHHPRYNVKLRDDKDYLYLKIGRPTTFPRVYTTRARQVASTAGASGAGGDGARYFGPYTNSQSLRETIKHLQRLFQFRTCALDMGKEYKRPCLLFHIKRCSGPCIRAVTPEDYDKGIQELIWFLEGKHDQVVDQLQADMEHAAEELEFERAASLRDRIASAQKAAEQQRVTVLGRGDLDAVAFAQEDGEVAVQVFSVRDDKVVNREEFVLQDAEGAPPAEILAQFLQQFYDRATYIPPSILVPAPVDHADALEEWLTDRRSATGSSTPDGAASAAADGTAGSGAPRSRRVERVRIEVPQRGGKKRLMDMVSQNASEALERMKLKWLQDERKTRGAVRELGEALALPDPPRRIECYDISHIQGTSTVASMVVFEDGRPARQAYRRFRIKAGDQNDDFASMYEVISRRFKRAAAASQPATGAEDEEPAPTAGELQAAARSSTDARRAEQSGEVPDDAGESGLMATEEASDEVAGAPGDRGGWGILPDLVIIDGGKGQLGAALEAMRDVAAPAVPTVGLAKEREELFRPGYSDPLLLPRTSQALYLVQRVRDEAHRFAVTYHQLVRKKRMVGSRLDTVQGIGPKRKKALVRQFGSVSGIKAASDEDLLAVPGITQEILDRLREQL
ncbi:MAG: Excinuclease ABC subunit C [uncultured Chloroflexi bacterium]|uniref:UvrABC system protein C n=1 Tax=uncultured Chloroflexota bacterium TaxID=166587 RepID=A0A6J4JCC5_9CHLR|nr:MAG: Excinuclease ABC subunit C [uncultured Chloroflexota bacterium]